MGYTNYWSQPTDFTDKEWTLVQKEFDYIREIAGDKIDAQLVHDAIVFDGGKGGNCETFVLEKEAQKVEEYKGQDLAFHFCKTRGMEYDIYVWHLLTFCQMIKKDFTCRRDGWAYEKAGSKETVADTILEKAKLLEEISDTIKKKEVKL